MTELVDYDINGSVARLTIQNGRGNRISERLCDALNTALDNATKDDTVRSILITAQGKVFSNGIDLNWLDREAPLDALIDLCVKIENSAKPVTVGLQGDAFGAGVDLALAGHYRIAAPRVQIAFSDISLGVPACAGATQRLPRLLGAEAALLLMLSGKPVRANALGHVFEAEIPGDFIEGATRYAQSIADKERGPKPTSASTHGFADPFAYQAAIVQAREDIADSNVIRSELIQCIESAALLPFEAGLTREREAFADCVVSRPSRAMRYAQRLAIHAEDETDAMATTCDHVDHITLVGLGTQGRAIAVASLLANIRVTVVVLDASQVETVKSAVMSALSQTVARLKQDDSVGAQAAILLDVTSDLKVCAQAPLVLVTERPKQGNIEALFQSIGPLVPDTTTIATTHELTDLEGCAETSGKPAQAVGILFGQPFGAGHRVELASATDTSDAARAAASRFVQQIGKSAVSSLYTPGGIAGTVQLAYWQALNHLLRKGASFSGIDTAMRAFGFARGPFQDLDQMSIPDAHLRAHTINDALSGSGQGLVFLDAMFEVDLYGARAGKGFYLYEQGSDTHPPNPEAIKLVHGLRGDRREAVSKEDTQKACIAAMANMGAGLVREELVAQPSDVDGLVNQRLGFSARRGGPMQAADHIGLLRLRNLLNEMATEDRAFEPDPLLDDLIKNGKSFASLNRWS